MAPNKGEAELFIKHLPDHLWRKPIDPDCLKPILPVIVERERESYAWLTENTYRFWTTKEVCDLIRAGELIAEFTFDEDGYPSALKVNQTGKDPSPDPNDPSGCIDAIA